MKGGRIALPAEYLSEQDTGNYSVENGQVYGSRAQMGCENRIGPDHYVQNGGRANHSVEARTEEASKKDIENKQDQEAVLVHHNNNEGHVIVRPRQQKGRKSQKNSKSRNQNNNGMNNARNNRNNRNNNRNNNAN